MPTLDLGMSVFDAAIYRIMEFMEMGATICVSFSGGKDSGVCLDLALIAAEQTGRYPVHCIMRDEEIMFPGTFEYCERAAKRDGVVFHWVSARQPIPNAFDRHNPLWWVFDPELPPEKWVRQPPDFIKWLPPNTALYNMLSFELLGLDPEKDKLCNLVGLRAAESVNRRRGIFSMGGHYYSTGNGTFIECRPLYDWKDSDIWKAINDNGWDYNSAYDVMHRMGVSKRQLRIAPPTFNPAGAHHLVLAAKAWPEWFERVSQRCPGVRTVAKFGSRALSPIRRVGESWEDVFNRTCIKEAPEWIRKRSIIVRDNITRKHARHSTVEFPQNKTCIKCGIMGSWEKMANTMYTGDPFLSVIGEAFGVSYVQPEDFRPGAGYWKKGGVLVNAQKKL